MRYDAVSQLAPLAVAVPLIAAALLMPMSKFLPRGIRDAIASLTALAVTGMCVALTLHARSAPVVYWMGGWAPIHKLAIGISFVVDPMNGGLASLVGFLVFAASVFTWKYFDSVGTLFHTLLMVFLAAMAGFALTGDIFNMFVFFELMGAAAFALTAYKIEEAEAIEGAINFAITNTIGALCVLLGIALLYGRTGALNMAQMGIALAERHADGLVVGAFALIVVGFFVKGAVVPFHFWLDDAHAVAPTPICILFSGVMVQLGLYAVARLYWTVFSGALGPHVHALRDLFLTAGIVTALVGATMSYSQTHLKRLLAFSTVSHSGMFVCAIGLFNAAGTAGAALFIAAHGLIKAALFICAGILLNRFGSVDENALYAKGKAMPVTGTLYLIGGLALAGLPPFGISGAKVLYDAAMRDRGLFAIAIVITFASALDAAAVLRVGGHVFLGLGRALRGGGTPARETTEPQAGEKRTTPWTMLAPAGLLLAASIWIGTSTPFAQSVGSAATSFVDRPAYAHAVLGDAAHAWPAVKAQRRTVADITMNLSAASLAILLALLGLYRRRIPKLIARVFVTVLGPPLALLRGLHSGIFTDYVAYLVFGIAAYGVWLVAAWR